MACAVCLEMGRTTDSYVAFMAGERAFVDEAVWAFACMHQLLDLRGRQWV